jgi:hypothetical protein
MLSPEVIIATDRYAGITDELHLGNISHNACRRAIHCALDALPGVPTNAIEGYSDRGRRDAQEGVHISVPCASINFATDVS